eukprot:SRR837773.13068.p1 GENE.SRR837773.13068~~SRR837773.13068.p1  ORF type:complete len:556 (-),score=103.51 SRR837773.13068:220-1839(-)
MGTRSYVLWMDELAEPVLHDRAEGGDELGGHSAAAALAGAAGRLARGGGSAADRGTAALASTELQESLTLADPLEEFLRSARSRSADVDPQDGETAAQIIVDVLTSVVAILWLGWVVRMHDLRSWTKALLTGALLAFLKGFLAWATVLPDAAGWRSCRDRLGLDGLTYYRELSSGSAGGGGIGFFQAWQDIILLEMRGLWLVSRATRQSVCADTMFSSTVSFTVLFAASFFDALRASTKRLDDRLETRRGWSARRSTVLALVGTFLMVVLLAQLASALCSVHHYTLDVAIALPLTLMVYSSVPVALASEQWSAMSVADDEGRHFKGDDAEAQAPLAAGSNPTSPVAPTRGISMPPLANDLGIVTVPPCMVPFCSFGGSYHLRDEPGTPLHKPWNEDIQRLHEQQVRDFRAISEENAGRRRQLEEALEEERIQAKKRAGKAAVRVDSILSSTERQLAEEEERRSAEARQRADAEREAAVASAEKAKAELALLASRELVLGERRSRLSGELEQARWEARQTQEIPDTEGARRKEESEAAPS